MLIVGRPRSFLEPGLRPGGPPVLVCPPVLVLVLSSGFSMPSRASFPGCTSPLGTANRCAACLRSRLSRVAPRASRGAGRQLMDALRGAGCGDASSLRGSFCSPFSLTGLSAASAVSPLPLRLALPRLPILC